MLAHFVDMGEDNISMNQNRTQDISTMGQPSSGFVEGLTDAFIDVIVLIGTFLAFLINITAAPLALFTQIPDIPIQIVYLIGIPLAAAWFIAIAYFIKGGGD
jgi:hypothetical protein